MIILYKKYSTVASLVIILTIAAVTSGCAPLLIGAGAVGGYAVAKND